MTTIARSRLFFGIRCVTTIALLLLSAGCGKSSPPASATADKSAPRTVVSATPDDSREPPPEDDVVPRPRPRVLLWVEGSPDENTIWRGWPALVRVQTLAGDPPSDVTMRGPSEITLTKGKNTWVISASASDKLAVGAYVVSAGGGRGDIVIEDSPRELTAEQQSVRSRLLVLSAVALGDAPAVKQAADDWVRHAPDAFEAREAQGDALRAAGDTAGALDAYNEALRRVPRGIDPPPGVLHAKISSLLREQASGSATKPATEPGIDETRYFELIDAGDKAVATGDRNEAARRYSAAESFRRDRAPALSSIELDDKRAALNASPLARTSAPGENKSVPIAVAESPSVFSRETTSQSAETNSPHVASHLATPVKVVPAAELDDAKIRVDANGQWAASASASSQYGSTGYSAARATGAPNISVAGDSPEAWCPANKNDGTDWLEVTFANPVHATDVRVRQNNAPGAIMKVEAIESDGATHIWWQGADPHPKAEVREIVWFAVDVPKTEYVVARVKITLNLTAAVGWKQIDAVQLVGTAE